MKFNVSDKIIMRLRTLLSERIGYVLPLEFRTFLVRQLGELFKRTDLASPEVLTSQLEEEATTSRLWKDFISLITISESYFYRNPIHIEMLQKTILPHLGEIAKTRPVHIWSAGCAKGEEPYTLSILLHEILPQKLLDGISIKIIATDIDDGGLQAGREGQYGSWAFRQTPAFIQQKYFSKEENLLKLSKKVQRLVQFETHHLSEGEAPFFPPNGFDLILCRNVMMYLRMDFRRHAGQTLASLLRPGGILIPGQVERVNGAEESLVHHVIKGSSVYFHPTSSEGWPLVKQLLHEHGERGEEHRISSLGSKKSEHCSLGEGPLQKLPQGFLPLSLPQEKHPNDTLFLLKNDALPTPKVRNNLNKETVFLSVFLGTTCDQKPSNNLSSEEQILLSKEDQCLMAHAHINSLNQNDFKRLKTPISISLAVPTNLIQKDAWDRVRAFMYSGKMLEAQREVDLLIGGEPFQSNHYCLLALVHLKAEEADEAMDALRRATYCNPNNLTAFYLWWLIGTRFYGFRWEKLQWTKRHLRRLIQELPNAHPVPLLKGITAGDIRYLLVQTWSA